VSATRRGLACAAFGASLGCAGAPVAEPVELPRSRPVAAPAATTVQPESTRDVETCRIVGRGSADDPEITISTSEALDDAIAVLDPGLVDVAWTDLDVQAERAAIEIRSGAVRLVGWAATKRQPFRIRQRIDVRTRHLYLLPGSPIGQPDAVSGGRVRFRAPTGFEEPREVVVQTGCDNLSYGSVARPDALPSGGRQVVAARGRLELHEGPMAASFLGVTFRGRDVLLAFEEEAGFVHVVERPTEDLVVDAWVPKAELADPEPSTDHGRLAGCKQARAPVIRFQRQPLPFATTTTDVEVRASAQPDARVIGTMMAGTEVRVGAAQGARVAVDPPESSVRPPKGKHFWITRASVGPSRDEMVDCRSAECDDFVRLSRPAPPKGGDAAPCAKTPRGR